MKDFACETGVPEKECGNKVEELNVLANAICIFPRNTSAV